AVVRPGCRARTGGPNAPAERNLLSGRWLHTLPAAPADLLLGDTSAVGGVPAARDHAGPGCPPPAVTALGDRTQDISPGPFVPAISSTMPIHGLPPTPSSFWGPGGESQAERCPEN